MKDERRSVRAKFHPNGYTHGHFQKSARYEFPWNWKSARRIARFGATRDARDKSARAAHGKRWTTVQGLFSPGWRTLSRGTVIHAWKSGGVEGREYTWNGRRRSRKVSGGGMKGGAREKLVEEAIRRCVGN